MTGSIFTGDWRVPQSMLVPRFPYRSKRTPYRKESRILYGTKV